MLVLIVALGSVTVIPGAVAAAGPAGMAGDGPAGEESTRTIHPDGERTVTSRGSSQ